MKIHIKDVCGARSCWDNMEIKNNTPGNLCTTCANQPNCLVNFFKEGKNAGADPDPVCKRNGSTGSCEVCNRAIGMQKCFECKPGYTINNEEERVCVPCKKQT
eukprot:Pgem_evm1s9482